MGLIENIDTEIEKCRCGHTANLIFTESEHPFVYSVQCSICEKRTRNDYSYSEKHSAVKEWNKYGAIEQIPTLSITCHGCPCMRLIRNEFLHCGLYEKDISELNRLEICLNKRPQIVIEY